MNLKLPIALILIAFLSACGGGGGGSSAPPVQPPPSQDPPPVDPDPTVILVPSGSAEEFSAYLKKGLAQWSGIGDDDQMKAVETLTDVLNDPETTSLINDFTSSNAPQPSPGAPADAADINVQVSGVDEADRARFTGDTLYVAEMLEIHVLPVSNGATSLATSLRLGHPSGDIQGLYLNMGNASDDQLIAISSEYPRYWTLAYEEPWQWRGGVTHLDLFNINDEANPIMTNQLTLEGYLMTTRRIGNMLYLVTRYTPEVKGLMTPATTEQEKTDNAELISNVTVAELLPTMSGVSNEAQPLVIPENCFVPENNNQNIWQPSIVTLTAIDLSDPADFQSICMADDVSGYYVSQESFYLTSGRYGEVIALGAPTTSDAAFAPEPPQDKTVVHKFALTPQGPAYVGSGEVSGTFSGGDPAYRMGEHEGYLSIVTSGAWGQDHRLTILGDPAGDDYRLQEMGHIPNDTAPATIGKEGEQIYSSRIIGDRAYIVTYRNIDPVYVIDLANPAAPMILGELEIPGYSTYLHPVSDNLLMGIGKDAVVEDGQAWYQGLNIRLFDMSDPTHPQTVSQLTLGGRGSESTALYDPHAFMVSGNIDDGNFRFGLPVELHEMMGNMQSASTWHPWSSTGLHLFEITNANNPAITPAGVVDSGLKGECWSNLSRGFIDQDNVYFLYANMMIASTWTQPTATHMTQMGRDQNCGFGGPVPMPAQG